MIGPLQFLCDYKENAIYRQSFNRLALATFARDFESWYQQGFWDDKYICYSYVDGKQMVANLSAYKMYFTLNGQRKTGVQLGPAMTLPAYRRRGLMGKLVEDLVRHYEKQTDFIYGIAANRQVMSFWAARGFILLEEKQFFLDLHANPRPLSKPGEPCQKLDMGKANDVQLLVSLAMKWQPAFGQFYLGDMQNQLLLFCLNHLREHIYYFPARETIAIYKQEAGITHLYALLFLRKKCTSDMISGIIDKQTREVIFYFTPEFDDIHVQCRNYQPEKPLLIKPVPEIAGNLSYPRP